MYRFNSQNIAKSAIKIKHSVLFNLSTVSGPPWEIENIHDYEQLIQGGQVGQNWQDDRGEKFRNLIFAQIVGNPVHEARRVFRRRGVI